MFNIICPYFVFKIVSDWIAFLLVSLSWLSLRICFILPLLPITEVWWQTRLCLFEKTSAWPFHSWRFEPCSSIYVLFLDVPCSVLLDKIIIGTKWLFLCPFGLFTCTRVPVWLCLWLDHFEISAISKCHCPCPCHCKWWHAISLY